MIKFLVVTFSCDDCKKELVIKIWPGEPIDLERDLERNLNEHGWILDEGISEKCLECVKAAA